VSGSGGDRLALLTESQAAALDAVLDRLIPGDAEDPGAREANVLRYVQRALAGDYRDAAATYAEGLAALDAHAATAHGRVFAALSPTQQDAIVADLELDRVPGFPRGSAAFFELVRRHALEGMFGDPAWGGNAGLAGWSLLGYPGPRLEWAESDQRLGAAGG